MRIADVEEDIDHELVSKEQICRDHEMAALASEDYRDKNPLLVAVLKGAVNTLAAFTQAMSIPVQIDFMSLSSYGSGTVSSGEVTVRQDLSADVARTAHFDCGGYCRFRTHARVAGRRTETSWCRFRGSLALC